MSTITLPEDICKRLYVPTGFDLRRGAYLVANSSGGVIDLDLYYPDEKAADFIKIWNTFASSLEAALAKHSREWIHSVDKDYGSRRTFRIELGESRRFERRSLNSILRIATGLLEPLVVLVGCRELHVLRPSDRLVLVDWQAPDYGPRSYVLLIPANVGITHPATGMDPLYMGITEKLSRDVMMNVFVSYPHDGAVRLSLSTVGVSNQSAVSTVVHQALGVIRQLVGLHLYGAVVDFAQPFELHNDDGYDVDYDGYGSGYYESDDRE